jgi:hypothetical protein
MSQELKSVQQIIAILQEDMNTLKKEFMQGLTNVHKYEEGTFLFVKSKSWTKADVDFYKKISHNFKNSSPSTIRIVNRF